MKNLVIGDHVRIGYLNVVRGGDEVRIGRYAEIIRLNEINSIPNPVVANPVDPRFLSATERYHCRAQDRIH